MIEFVLSTPTWVGCGLTMVSMAVAGLAVYFAFYKLISKYQREDLKHAAGNLFRGVVLFLSLMLSLAFTEVIVELRAIRSAVEREALAISDLFEDLKRFDIKKTRKIRATLVDYTQSVIDDDWPALANDRLGQQAGTFKSQLTEAVMNLKPATPVQEKLMHRIQDNDDALSDHRFIRLDHSLAQPPIFVYIIIFGFLVTMACMGTHQPQLPFVLLASLYTVFVGVLLFIVLSLSDPFQSYFGVAPTAFEYLIETLRPEI